MPRPPSSTTTMPRTLPLLLALPLLVLVLILPANAMVRVAVVDDLTTSPPRSANRQSRDTNIAGMVGGMVEAHGAALEIAYYNTSGTLAGTAGAVAAALADGARIVVGPTDIRALEVAALHTTHAETLHIAPFVPLDVADVSLFPMVYSCGLPPALRRIELALAHAVLLGFRHVAVVWAANRAAESMKSVTSVLDRYGITAVVATSFSGDDDVASVIRLVALSRVRFVVLGSGTHTRAAMLAAETASILPSDGVVWHVSGSTRGLDDDDRRRLDGAFSVNPATSFEHEAPTAQFLAAYNATRDAVIDAGFIFAEPVGPDTRYTGAWGYEAGLGAAAGAVAGGGPDGTSPWNASAAAAAVAAFSIEDEDGVFGAFAFTRESVVNLNYFTPGEPPEAGRTFLYRFALGELASSLPGAEWVAALPDGHVDGDGVAAWGGVSFLPGSCSGATPAALDPATDECVTCPVFQRTVTSEDGRRETCKLCPFGSELVGATCVQCQGSTKPGLVDGVPRCTVVGSSSASASEVATTALVYAVPVVVLVAAVLWAVAAHRRRVYVLEVERKAADRRTDDMRSFVGYAYHELRNPMNGVMCGLRFAVEHLKESSGVKGGGGNKAGGLRAAAPQPPPPSWEGDGGAPYVRRQQEEHAQGRPARVEPVPLPSSTASGSASTGSSLALSSSGGLVAGGDAAGEGALDADHVLGDLSSAIACAEHTMFVLNNVLDMARIDDGTLQLVVEPTDAGAVCHRVLTMLAGVARNGVQLEVELPLRGGGGDLEAGAPTLAAMADSRRLQQVLLNVAGNALKFTQAGRVVIRAFPAPDSDKRAVRFEVADTGPGVSEDDRKFIFSDESRVYFGTGSGLGLLLCRRFLSLMGSELRLSHHGAGGPGASGATFWFDLASAPSGVQPASAPAAAAVQDAADSPRGARPARLSSGLARVRRLSHPRTADGAALPERGRGWNALVVDDSSLNRRIIKRCLTRGPFARLAWTFEEASTAEEALERLRNPPAGARPVHVLVIDENMQPSGGVIKGHEAAQVLNGTAARPPIIVGCTGNVQDEALDTYRSAGMDLVWAKPVPRPSEMLADMERASGMLLDGGATEI